MSFVRDADSVLAVAPDGLVLIGLDGRKVRMLVPARAFPRYDSPTLTAWTESRDALALNVDGQPFLVRLDPLRVQPLDFSTDNISWSDYRFSPDGRYLSAVSHGEGGARVLAVVVATGAIRSERLGPNTVHLDGWSNDGNMLLREHHLVGPGGERYTCEIADPVSLERVRTGCWDSRSWTYAFPGGDPDCPHRGSVFVSSTAMKPGVPDDTIILRDPVGEARALVTIEGWAPSILADIDAPSPNLGRVFFSPSCRYVVFHFDDDAYVVDVETKNRGRLTRGAAVWPLPGAR